ncbi:4045_t:CDS:2 [Ambispora gerdemannii]|uniref:Peptide hydrolase n=1 Tax=Ambispora gerdemannii TaxID=144530 RepID=A0A9N9GNA4_9GLOM|nr:4045_t:CDS:2 [Ambispora gerdemannii]
MNRIIPLVFLIITFAVVLLGKQRLISVSVNHEIVNVADKDDCNNLRLIQTDEDEPAEWMTEKEVWKLLRKGTKFMDITDNEDLGTVVKSKSSRQFPIKPSYQKEVSHYKEKLSTKYMKESLKNFTSFHNRYYRSAHGAASSIWLYKEIKRIADRADDYVRISVRKFKHKWVQISIIARFEGSDRNKEDQVVIIGAHQDSVNMWMPTNGRSPGADDDGSGTTTILEAFRVLVEGGFKPHLPVEFHWYSAEEAGLLGSQAIAKKYERQHKDVIAMLQNDMTGYVGNRQESFGIVTDHVDRNLTDFVKSLIDEYTDIPWANTKCGYACSDHASWRKAGYPSAFVIESKIDYNNPYIHTVKDTIDLLNFNHMLEFSKLAVGFAVELSHIDESEKI